MNLQEILKKHKMWLNGEVGGERANLSNTNLKGANLKGADLTGAYLSEADLRGANLSYANLSYANLSYADLSYANLSNANLRGADLSYANLRGTDLTGAYLSEADLRGANLRGANLENCIGLGQQVVASEGVLIGYKKVSGSVILKLAIPRSARRVNAIGSRKCRADKAKVLAAFNLDGTPCNGITSFVSQRDPKFVYTLGKDVIESNFDPSDRIECASGIHFFITFSEAREY